MLLSSAVNLKSSHVIFRYTIMFNNLEHSIFEIRVFMRMLHSSFYLTKIIECSRIAIVGVWPRG